MSAGEPTPKPRTPGWIKTVLVLSLAGNLLVLGVVAGAVFDHRRDGRPGTQISMDGPNPFLRAMSREDAAQVRRLLRPEAGQLLAGRREVGRAMNTILSELRAETPSESALRVAFAQLGAVNATRAEVAGTVMLDYLLGLDADARRAFADRLEDATRQRGPSRAPRPSP